jgi:hypothetical protein
VHRVLQARRDCLTLNVSGRDRESEREGGRESERERERERRGDEESAYVSIRQHTATEADACRYICYYA